MIASFIAVAGGVSDASREARAAEAAENAVVAELTELTAGHRSAHRLPADVRPGGPVAYAVAVIAGLSLAGLALRRLHVMAESWNGAHDLFDED